MRSEFRLNGGGSLPTGRQEIFLEGKSYLSLKKAAELSTYHSDYLGRLVRNGKLGGRRLGIQWFIEKDSLLDFVKAHQDSAEIIENISREADFRVKVEPSTPSLPTLQDFLPRLVKKDSAPSAARLPDGQGWESTLLGEEQIPEPFEPIKNFPSPPVRFHFPVKRFLAPVLAALLLFSFGLFGESLALAGKSFVKNTRLALENISLPAFSLPALSKLNLPEFPSLDSEKYSRALALSFSSVVREGQTLFSKIASFFQGAQDAFLTLLGVPSLEEEELAVLPSSAAPGLPAGEAGETASTPPSGKTSDVGGLPPAGRAGQTSDVERELASLRAEIRLLKSAGLSVSSQIAPIDLAAVDEKLQAANSAVLAQVKASLASIESRIQPAQPNPVMFFTVPNKTPEKQLSGVSAGFGSFDIGLDVSGNFAAYGKVALGRDDKSVSITSSTWNITSAGAASGFASLSANSTSAGTLTAGNATFSGNLTFSNNSTTTIPSSLINAFSFATSTTVVPFFSFDTLNYRIGLGTTTPGRTFSVAGDILASGSLNVIGTLSAQSSSFTVSATTTATNQLQATAAPASPHTFGTWAINTAGSNVTNSSLLVNPSSSIADGNLFGVAVADGVKFLVDAEGDVFANGLTTVGGTTLASTTASTFTVENSFFMGDAANADTHIFKGQISHFATTTGAAYTMWNSTVSGDLLRLRTGATDPTTSFVFGANGQAAFGTTTHSGLSVLTIGATTTNSIPLTLKGVTGQTADLFRILNSSDTGLVNVTSSGLVGIGTTSPASLLSVHGNALFSGNLSLANLTATGTLAVSGTATSTFGTGGFTIGTSQFVVQQTSGNVGIGTSTPSNLFSVQGNGLFSGNVSLANLTATGTLAISGAITSTASGANTFPYASSTALTVSGTGFFGTASTTNLTVSSLLSGRVPYVTTAGAFADSSALAWNNSASRLTATYASSTAISATNLDLSGALTANSASLTTALGIASGGTNATSFTTSGNAVYYNGTSLLTAPLGSAITIPYASTTALTVSGTASTTNFTASAMTSGSVLFAGAGGLLSQDNSNLFWDDTNNRLGIASTSPWGLLSVNPNGISGPSFVVGSSTATNFIVTNGGNVGIGTTGPSGTLHVRTATAGTWSPDTDWNDAIIENNGRVGLTLVSPDASIQGIYFSSPSRTSSYTARILAQYNGGADTLTLGTNAGDTVMIKSGNVGIGTTGPLAKLDLRGDQVIFGTQALYFGTNATLSNRAVVDFNSTTNVLQFRSIDSANATNAAFQIHGGGTAFTTGNVGIGTTTPGANLHVVNDFIVSGNGNPTDTADSISIYGNGTNIANIRAQGSDATTLANMAFHLQESDGGGGITPLYLKNDGNVGIGTTAPGAKLTVTDTSANDFDIAPGSPTIIGVKSGADLRIKTSDLPRMTIQGGGNVGIGTTSPWRLLSVAGTVGFSSSLTSSATGDYLCINTTTYEVTRGAGSACTTSSERYKQNFEELNYGLDAVLQMRPISFEYKPELNIGSGRRIGFLAEEMFNIIPEAVVLDKEGLPAGIEYEKLTAVLAKAVQELYGQLKELMARVTSFADVFTTKKLCVEDVCVTRDQFLQMVNQANATPVAPTPAPAPAPEPDTTPPTITINGNNPAVIDVGSTYADLGAMVTDNVDQNLGYTTAVDGILMAEVQIDTATTSQHAILYIATDNAGNTASATRTVQVVDPNAMATAGN